MFSVSCLGVCGIRARVYKTTHTRAPVMYRSNPPNIKNPFKVHSILQPDMFSVQDYIVQIQDLLKLITVIQIVESDRSEKHVSTAV